jgi:4-amino-4-deoxy-L-arabinose transferase-like glycosyltransferase
MTTPPPTSPLRGEAWALALVLAIGATMRIAWNDVAQYSRADETTYVLYTHDILEKGWWEGFADLDRRYLATPSLWDYPDPLRWGWFLITTATCGVAGRCDHRTLAWISTVAGIATIGVVYAIGRRLLGHRPALLAAAFAACSPLLLALSRRALQDSTAALAALAALWAFLRVLDRAPGERAWGRYAAAIALMTAAIAIKESFLLYYPALAAIFLVGVRARGWRPLDLALFAVPCALDWGLYSLFTRSATDFFAVAGHALGSFGNEYAVQYQSGPPHRPLFDLFLLAPLVSLAATGAMAMIANRPQEAPIGARRLALFVVAALATFALTSRSVRFVAAVDPLLALLAAWTIVEHQIAPRGLGLGAIAAVAAIDGAVGIALFHRIFLVRGVYDPVTYSLLWALDAIPR